MDISNMMLYQLQFVLRQVLLCSACWPQIYDPRLGFQWYVSTPSSLQLIWPGLL